MRKNKKLNIKNAMSLIKTNIYYRESLEHFFM